MHILWVVKLLKLTKGTLNTTNKKLNKTKLKTLFIYTMDAKLYFFFLVTLLLKFCKVLGKRSKKARMMRTIQQN